VVVRVSRRLRKRMATTKGAEDDARSGARSFAVARRRRFGARDALSQSRGAYTKRQLHLPDSKRPTDSTQTARRLCNSRTPSRGDIHTAPSLSVAPPPPPCPKTSVCLSRTLPGLLGEMADAVISQELTFRCEITAPALARMLVTPCCSLPLVVVAKRKFLHAPPSRPLHLCGRRPTRRGLSRASVSSRRGRRDADLLLAA
jgi:hypothetical protein